MAAICNTRALALILMLGLGSGGQAQAELPGGAGTPSALGVWKNPKNTVHMEIRPCGEAACGYVIWSTPGADAASRKGSGKPIVGQQILREFVWDKRGYFKGKVYAPDVNLTVSGVAEPIGSDTLKARGCLLGKLVCKTQVWTRVK
jgi:uncharacterized protein (DUF2147 family)